MSVLPPATPSATYRLQFTPAFGFRDATAILPYLQDLGIGHLYASPYLKARPGSMHGYDVVDPNALNPEIGTPEEHAAMIAAAQSRGMGHILDFVPNHMGVGADNPWWMDVLEWGEASPYAGFFDIDWNPLKPELHKRVLVPTLSDHFGKVLEGGAIGLTFDAEHGAFFFTYGEQRYPLALTTYPVILQRAAAHGAPGLLALAARCSEPAGALRSTAPAIKAALAQAVREPTVLAALERALRELAVDPADARSANELDALLGQQHYRLASWRVAGDDINYRRFFDVNDLAGLRVEEADVLGQTHRLAFELIAAGALQGVRIDHVDGLYNPGGYCNFVADRAHALGHPLYVVVEKILGPRERLRSSWLIAGTTGYEFANLVNGLFVDARAEAAMTRIYARALGYTPDYDDIAFEAKRRIMASNLASDLTVLATSLSRIAASDRRSSDFTYNGLRDALMDVIAGFPVYRTYVVSEAIEAQDREFINAAVNVARRRSTLADDSIFTFIADVLTLRVTTLERSYNRNAVLRFVMRFQQYTSPVMAKAIEDTVFYRYVRLLSLNEVGGNPKHFGTSVAEFHAANAERATTHPHSMLGTSTHDHKRGEDVRTRINVLTEIPSVWSRALRRWSRMNRGLRGSANEGPAPDANDEYFLYQTLIGTWPAAWTDPVKISDEDYTQYVERIVNYVRKAQREAKRRTSWMNPVAAYEEATEAFVRGIFDRSSDTRFSVELAAFVADIAPAAMTSSLAQAVLKLTSPGVPDIYQGCELWDHSLVDPDNRRPVDYPYRAALLAEVDADPPGARASWLDGRVKLLVTRILLRLRAKHREVFLDGPYTPLVVEGSLHDHIIAFARGVFVVVVPRLVRELIGLGRPHPTLAFGDEAITLAPDAPRRYVDIFTDQTIDAIGSGSLCVRDVLANFPVSVLIPASENGRLA